MRPGAVLAAALVLGGLAGAGPSLAQTQVPRGDQAPSKPATTTTAPSRTAQSPPTRAAPSSLPVDPGGFSGAPSSGGSGAASPAYGPAGPAGTRATRPRRSAEPPPDSGEDIPYVDPPAAPGYESAQDAGPMRTAGGKPAPAAASPAAPASKAASSPAPAVPAAASSPGAVAATPPSIKPDAATIAEAAASPPPLDRNILWIALAGLAAMLVAAGLGLRHILTAPHLSFRVTVDHGLQSAPRFKGAAS